MTIEELIERLQADGYPATLEIPDYLKLKAQTAEGPLGSPLPEPRIIIYQEAAFHVLTSFRRDVTEEEYAHLVEQLKHAK